MRNERLLENKICLVTGASRGIGRVITQRFAEEGAVVFANSLPGDPIDDWAEEISVRCSTKVIPCYFDVTQSGPVRDIFVKIKNQYGRIDALVNNAGLISYELIALTSIEKMREMFEVNVFAVFQAIQLASRIMSRQKSGSIINIASIVGVNGVSGQAAYSASKGAIVALTKSAAKELAPSNIRVNAVAPGMIGTERLVKNFSDKFSDKLNFVGMGRLGEPTEVANACLYLASDLSSYVTGQIIGVDGSTTF